MFIIEMKIFEARTQRNLTIMELAEITKISVGALHYYETGKRSPTLAQLEKIAIALHVHITDLFISENK